MSFLDKYRRRSVKFECHETRTTSRKPMGMNRKATSNLDQPTPTPTHPDSYCQILTHSSSSPSSPASNSPLSSASSLTSSITTSPTSPGKKKSLKRQQANKKRLKKKMDSEELQHVSDLSLSYETNNNSHNNSNNEDTRQLISSIHPSSLDYTNQDVATGGFLHHLDRTEQLPDHPILPHHNLPDPNHLQVEQLQQQQGTEPDLRLQHSGSRKSSSSSIRVEIPDIWGDESINFTTSTLRVCKEQVLMPYWRLLVFIGWRGIGKESVNSHLPRWKILNVLYTGTIIMLLVYTYMYEMLACEWKLDIQGSKHVHPTIGTPTTIIMNTTLPITTTTTTTANTTYPKLWDDPHDTSPPPYSDADTLGGKRHHHHKNISETTVSRSHKEGCHHIITTYLIPNLLHLLAYCLGLYYFRSQENEQLYALMEKVFLQATPHQTRTASQHKMIIRLRVLLIIGSFWVLFTVFIQCLYIWAFDFPEMPLYTKIGKCGYWIMLVVELMGRTVFNSVILAIVMNYVTQCEMIKFYVQGLTTRLLEKSTDLKAAMKDLLTIRHSVSLLNGVISKMTSLVTFIVAELSIIGVVILIMNDIDDTKVWIYRGLFPFAWMVMLVLPLWQAARVNSIINRIQKISLEMRVFGYKGASILDLDSFLQFVTLIKPKAKLFHLPMLPAYLISAIVLASFILLILIQTGSIAIMSFVF